MQLGIVRVRSSGNLSALAALRWLSNLESSTFHLGTTDLAVVTHFKMRLTTGLAETQIITMETLPVVT
jgi:hypothetical protein